MDPINYSGLLPTPDLGASLIGGIQAGIQQRFQQQQLQRQASQQQLLDGARMQFIQNPTPQNVRALATLDPQGFAAVKDAHAMQTGDQQRQDLQDMTTVAGYLRAGRGDDAASIVQRRIDAMKSAGQDTASLDQLLNTIQSNPEAAKGMVNYGLAAILGPDKFGEAFPALEGNDRNNDELPSKIALTKAQTRQASASADQSEATAEQTKNPRPETAATTDASGNPVFYDKNAPPPVAPPPGDFTKLASAIEADENSTGDPAAKNSRSSATGNGQFINSTWLDVVKSSRPDLAKGKTDAQILAMRSDPAISREVTAANAQINAGALEVARQPVNGATLAMAHKLGPGDANKVLSAPVDAPLKGLLSPRVLAANPQLAKQTAGQYYGDLIKKFGANPISGEEADPNMLSGDALEYVAQQYIATGQLPPLGNGKIATRNRDAVINRAAQVEKETGSTGYDAVARHQVLKATGETLAGLTKMKGMIKASEDTVAANMDIVTSLLPKGAGKMGSPLLNAPIQHLRKDVFGSADVAQFDGAIGTVADEYAKVMSTSTGSGGAPTSDSARKEAYSRLGKAATPAQLLAVMNTMKQEMGNRTDSLEKQRALAEATIRNRGVAPQQAEQAGAAAPKAGQVVDGYRFKGGNPADQRSWVKVQ